MKKLLLIALLVCSFSYSQNGTGNPTPHRNGSSFPNASEVTSADTIPILFGSDHRLQKYITRANFLNGIGGFDHQLTQDLITNGNYILTGDNGSSLILGSDSQIQFRTDHYGTGQGQFNFVDNTDRVIQAYSAGTGFGANVIFGQDDVNNGNLILYANNNNLSGSITVYNPSSFDTNIGRYYLGSSSGGFVIRAELGTNGSSTPSVAISDDDLTLQLPTSTNAAIDAGSLNSATTKRWVQDYVTANAGGSSTAATTTTDNASYDVLPGSDVQTDLNYADNLLYALQPFDGGVFDGSLALNKINNTYYNDYDLETSGTITFSVDTTSTKLFGKDYLRIISDGVTQFADSTNVANIFDEIPQGIPNGYVLAEGMYSFYAQQNPNHRAFSLSPVKSQVVIGDDSPYFEDAIFHIDNRKNTPTTSGSNITEIVNISEPSNPLINDTGSNQATWDAVDFSADFTPDQYMNCDDVFVNRGAHSFLYVGNIEFQTTQPSEFTMHYKPEVSSGRDFGIKIQGKIITVLNMKPDDNDQISSSSSRPTDPWFGDVVILVTVDSANGEMIIYVQNEVYSDTITIAIPVDTPAPYDLNGFFSRTGDLIFGAEAVTVWNKIMTPTEASEILTYYTSY